ncbi:MAG: replication-associated recombination protein A [Proteobacteria bacterium]|nr:replication-associated recombination protein A [Pseudomonadota bacterium]
MLFDLTTNEKEKGTAKNVRRPLADVLRPQSLGAIFGHEDVLAEEGTIRQALNEGALPSLILWGPPGCGKTTLAHVLARESGYRFVALSAALHSTTEVKQAFAEAEMYRAQGKNTLMLVDEIHRFNRTQQDLFLPYMENGTITLIGATTENPSFELNSALLSRAKVVMMKPLTEEALEKIVAQAEKTMGRSLPLTPQAKKNLLALADGDGRYLLNLVEELLTLKVSTPLSPEELAKRLRKRALRYDKSREEHYNLISALHKSLRGSDPDAALYWLSRMLAGGEEPLYILRRLVRFAVEDVGMADPHALVKANAAKEAYDFLGSPEGELAIAELVVYLATAPKSNAAYVAFGAAMKDARAKGSLMPPKHILNAPTELMQNEGYGKGYHYDHDTEEGFSGQDYFPEEMGRRDYYQPTSRGYEREVKARLERFAQIRDKNKGEK